MRLPLSADPSGNYTHIAFLLGLLVAATLSFSAWQSPTGKNQKPATPKQENASDRNKEHTKPPWIAGQSVSPQSKSQKSDDRQNNSNDKSLARWFKAQIIIAGFGVLLTAFYVIVSYFMLQAIKRQARIAQQSAGAAIQSADAAKVSADAIRDIERPWVIATLGSPTVEPVAGLEVIKLTCTIKNYGRTPAWIISFGIKRHNTPAIDSLPPQPDYREQEQIKGQASLPPGESINMIVPLHPGHLKSANAGELFIFVYGFVDYRDVFGRAHETRFCFRYHAPTTPIIPGGFYVSGPPDYNRQT